MDDDRLEHAPTFHLGHRPALDGVRGIAILLILVFHANLIFLGVRDEYVVLPGAFIGVDLFFVLSGFLITSLLLEEHRRRDTVRLGSFYRRRALRLLPALGGLLAVHAMVAVARGDDLHLERNGLLGAITYTSNWLPALHVHFPDDLGPLWSLAVEEQFYLVWPLLLVLVLRRRPELVGWVAAGAAAAGAITRLLLLRHYGSGYPIVYEHTAAKVDALMIGAWLAWFISRRGLPRMNGATLAAGGLAILAVVSLTATSSADWMYQWGFTVVALGAGALVLGAVDVRGPIGAALSSRPLRWLGKMSYSVYLWNLPMLNVVTRALADTSRWIWLVVWLVATMCAAVLSRRLIEEPFLRLRARRVTVPVA